MRPLQITLFVLGFAILTAQSFRDVYVKWLEPRGSVLDQFRAKAESDVARARNLAELVALYRDAHQKVEDYEKTHPPVSGPEFERNQTEPYKSEAIIRGAIEDWESTARERHDVVFFWCFGLVVLAGGLWVYRISSAWLGMTLITTGFCEMIWWCSPSFRSFGNDVEVERLLTLKIVLSLISWIILAGVWLVNERSRKSTPPPGFK